MPNKFLILEGSLSPGSSTTILSFPCLTILGSFVPTSSTLLLTISKAWSIDEFLISIIPNFDKRIKTFSFSIVYKNSKSLYFSKYVFIEFSSFLVNSDINNSFDNSFISNVENPLTYQYAKNLKY